MKNGESTRNDTASGPASTEATSVVDQLEKTAFNFCKAATLMLLTLPLGRYALPFVATVAGILFLAAQWKGQHTTRCVLRKPWIAGVFWLVVASLSLWWALR